jgi:hypothetical protein
MMDEGSIELGGRTEVKLPASNVVWLAVLEFGTQLVTAERIKTMVLKELTNDC